MFHTACIKANEYLLKQKGYADISKIAHTPIGYSYNTPKTIHVAEYNSETGLKKRGGKKFKLKLKMGQIILSSGETRFSDWYFYDGVDPVCEKAQPEETLKRTS